MKEPHFPLQGAAGGPPLLDQFAINDFPWPLTAKYEAVYAEIAANQPVSALWQLRDAWEALLKFLAVLAVADHVAAVTDLNNPRTRRVFALLLYQDKGKLVSDWCGLLDRTLKKYKDLDDPPAGLLFPDLGPLLHEGRAALKPMFLSDEHAYVHWRNSTLAHGVSSSDMNVHVDAVIEWLTRLNKIFDIGRTVFSMIELIPADAPVPEPTSSLR